MRTLASSLALVLAAALSLPAGAAGQQPQPRGEQKGTLVVRVEDDSSDVALRGARLRLVGQGAAAWVTGDDGTARLRNVPAGERVVQASLAGYAMRDVTVEVTPGGTQALVISLVPQVQEVTLEGLNVTSWGRSVILRGSGFYERQENWNGTFLTRDDVLARHPARLPDVFRQVRGFTVVRVANRDILATTRRQGPGGGYCTPRVYLNGIRVPGSDGDVLAHLSNILPTEVEGIEAYTSASSIPPQYSTSNVGCGLVLVWTRSSRRY